MRILDSATSAIDTVGPTFALGAFCAITISLLFKYCASRKYRASMPLGNAIRISLAFSLYGSALGIFLVLTGDASLVSVLGAVTTTASGILVVLYGKSADAEIQMALFPAIVAFFISVPLSFEYMHHYLSP